jgi:hypothetical protein
MSFNIKALAATLAIITGGSFLLVGLLNLAFPSYGVAYLQLARSVYPGYHGPAGFGSVIPVTLYGLVDGAVGGWIFGWLYNKIAGRRRAAA